MTAENKTPDQQENVISEYANELKQIEMEGYELAVRKARNALSLPQVSSRINNKMQSNTISKVIIPLWLDLNYPNIIKR